MYLPLFLTLKKKNKEKKIKNIARLNLLMEWNKLLALS